MPWREVQFRGRRFRGRHEPERGREDGRKFQEDHQELHEHGVLRAGRYSGSIWYLFSCLTKLLVYFALASQLYNKKSLQFLLTYTFYNLNSKTSPFKFAKRNFRTQVSVVTYSNQADLEIKFNDYSDKQKFYELLNNVDFSPQRTRRSRLGRGETNVEI